MGSYWKTWWKNVDKTEFEKELKAMTESLIANGKGCRIAIYETQMLRSQSYDPNIMENSDGAYSFDDAFHDVNAEASYKEKVFAQWLEKWEPGLAFWLGFLACFALLVFGLVQVLKKTVFFVSGNLN